MAQDGTLSARQRRFVRCLLTARSIREAARQCRVGERSARRWLKEPAIKAALAEAQDAAMQATAQRLTELTSLALDAVENVLSAPKSDMSVVRAADLTLSNLLKLRVLGEVEQRLDAMQMRLDAYLSGKGTEGDG